ncbi:MULTISPECIES: hypothetical protein [unclassified Bradyrhizobium]|uniref:hypothetical protein n=1 Tax=unclassified Bradyrhizobium TaxID=2631580 RepID=UPI0028ECAEC3|nr:MULTISPECIES: hypothetical protein [unclassified Bradyrhizobium]
MPSLYLERQDSILVRQEGLVRSQERISIRGEYGSTECNRNYGIALADMFNGPMKACAHKQRNSFMIHALKAAIGSGRPAQHRPLSAVVLSTVAFERFQEG